VRSSNADIGFAQDPDGDRLAVVDENGKAIGEEYTLVLSGEAYLKKRKTDIVCNLSTSMMIEDLARRFSVNVLRTKIGEINVTSELIDNNLHFGGEGNGGVIIPEINPCRDSIVAMGLILELLTHTKKTVSEFINGFPSYTIKKDRVDYKGTIDKNLFSSLLMRVKEDFKDHLINNIDGIKIYTKNEWLHIRPSNTEPIIRIMAEAKDEKRAEELISIGRSLIESL
jgi:phosphomannomutase